MHTIDRRAGEALIIGGGIEVSVVEIKGEIVVLGISTPDGYREEFIDCSSEGGRSQLRELVTTR